MHLSRGAAGILSFFGALAIGMAFGYLADDRRELIVEAPSTASQLPVAPVRAGGLLGEWRGTWGHRREPCTIEIDRVYGEQFYGTLRKRGAEIALVGTLDADGRTVVFEETEVLKLGTHMSEWSLGKNTGSFSADGRRLNGTGYDKWGEYGWDAVKD